MPAGPTRLVKLHSGRPIPGATAIVMNRDNSANRLGGHHQLPEGSALDVRLWDAQPARASREFTTLAVWPTGWS